MNPAIANKLIAAAESGEFQHGTRHFRKGDRYCILGVLCELYRRETGDGQWLSIDKDPDVLTFCPKDDWLAGVCGVPDAVRWWAEMNNELGVLPPPDGNWDAAPSLIDENDKADDYSLAVAFIRAHTCRI
jgi:hypothetical protein